MINFVPLFSYTSLFIMCFRVCKNDRNKLTVNVSSNHPTCRRSSLLHFIIFIRQFFIMTNGCVPHTNILNMF